MEIASEEANPANTWSWTSSLQNYETINFCHWRHPVCDTLLQSTMRQIQQVFPDDCSKFTDTFLHYSTSISIHFFFFFSCGTGARTQGLYIEPLYQSFLVMDFFLDRVLQTICPSWLWTMILLISVSWVSRSISVSHQHLDPSFFH
jgi:hypothetical protein